MICNEALHEDVCIVFTHITQMAYRFMRIDMPGNGHWMKANTLWKGWTLFCQDFAQRCANSQPNHLLGNILPGGIGKRKYPTSHVHNCFVFSPKCGKDMILQLPDYSSPLVGEIFTSCYLLGKIRKKIARTYIYQYFWSKYCPIDGWVHDWHNVGQSVGKYCQTFSQDNNSKSQRSRLVKV